MQRLQSVDFLNISHYKHLSHGATTNKYVKRCDGNIGKRRYKRPTESGANITEQD